MKSRRRNVTILTTLALAMPAAADVIYSNFQNISIPANYDGLYLNVETGAWNTPSNLGAGVSGWDINPFFGGSVIANSPDFQPVRAGTGSLDAVLNLSEGSTVGGSSTFSTFVQLSGPNAGLPGYGGSQTHMGGGAGQFTSGTEGYLGFRLNGSYYGSMRVVLTNNGSGAAIKDWAYDTSGAPVVVGAIKQVGQDIIISSGFTLASTSALIDSGGTTNLVKNGTGTNILKSTSTYTGTTTINQGTLAVNGTGSINSSAVNINGGTFRYNSSVAYSGTLTFTSGTIGGTNLTGSLGGLSIGTGQTISPGNSPGTADTTSQTWAAGGTYAWEMNDATGTAGSDPGWDLLSGTGNLNITATSGSEFNLFVTSLGIDDLAGNAINFNELLSYNWLIADFDTITNFAASAFSIDTSSFTNTFTGTFGVALGNSGSIGGDSSQIYLTYTAVPEPGTAVLTGLTLLALLRRKRN